MIHISQLNIQQFRNLQGLELKDLEQVNILFGKNNAGKTSVLETISTFCRPLDLSEWLSTARRRELLLSNTSVLESLKWLFSHNENNHQHAAFQGKTCVSGKGNFPIRRVAASFNEIRSEILSSEELVLLETSRKGVDLILTADVATDSEIAPVETISQKFQLWEDENVINPPQTICPMLPVRTIHPHAHRVERLQTQQFSDTAFQEQNVLVVSLLKMFDSDIEDVNILLQSGNRPVLYIKHRKLGLAPISSFGDGMRRVLLMATTIPLCKGGVLLIDEIETAIHTQALDKTFDWLVKSCVQNDIQLFATTHSLEALDTILEVSEDTTSFVGYRLQQRVNETTATRFSKEQLTRLREDLGREVRW